jgi:hypothetical protein
MWISSALSGYHTPAHESVFSSISSPSTLTPPAPVFHRPIAKRWLTPSSLGTQTAPPHPPVRCIGTRKKTSLTRECNSAMEHITHGSCVVKSARDVSRYCWPFFAGARVDAGGDGVGAAEAAAGVVEAEVEVVESASARTTLSAAWRRGCAEDMRVSRARYEGHAGSSGGDGTYDAMGS